MFYTLHSAKALEGDLNEKRLQELIESTLFQPIMHGVHVFLPVDWISGKASLSINAPLQSKRRLHPHVQDIYPISSPAIPHIQNGVIDAKLKEKRFVLFVS